ncbi:carbamate kinase [Candidatus Enterococcus ferrettii]|uniref:Carbamate kinase n=1 Tax=Candidatus Enterococcus ferrettii TaxID=2815324 RepID=A0ABV0EMD9_9ENTE|nr:carbamate kinase [Enterococcus sp. 665A]MBO1341464.1 carbamate kinase [Enterococcus sp. 665A]
MGLNVIALGGNAILDKIPTDEGQKEVVRKVASDIIEFIELGEQVVICHGNGPQVGNLLIQQKAGDSEKTPMMKLDTNVAMTEGSIGYWIQQAIQNELQKRNIKKSVISVITQVEVDAADPSFQDPTKPIGPFYTKEEAQQKMDSGEGIYQEDSGRGYRKVIASPKPKQIVEKEAILSLVAADVITVCVGGGGIPVIKNQDGRYEGVEAVIDKDLSANNLAKEINADRLIILTGVDNIYINYNQPDQKKLEKLTIGEAKQYIKENQFPPGSMLPKVESAIDFVKEGQKREAVITSIENLSNIVAGYGTRIVC